MNSFDYDILTQTMATSSAIRIMRSPNAPLILSFLFQQFKQSQRPTMPYLQLLEHLEAHIKVLNEILPEKDRYREASAKEYLRDWASETQRIIRICAQGSAAEEVVELTRDTERAISWIEELERRPFVGTESRFLTIFNLLEEIVARSTSNPETRLKQLERDRDAIQQEIDEIQQTGIVKQFSTTQIKERLLQAEDTARMMQRDFTLVWDNFKMLARQVQEEQLRPDARKGTLVAAVLDAEDHLKESDEGKSFYAFWQFLLNPERQREVYESDAVEQHRRLLSLDMADVLAQVQVRHPHRRPEFVELVAKARMKTPIRAFDVLTPSNPEYHRLVSAIDIPILLVIADNGVVSLETAQELQNLNPRLRVEQIQDAGHGLQYDQPERFEVVVRSFLRLVAAS